MTVSHLSLRCDIVTRSHIGGNTCGKKIVQKAMAQAKEAAKGGGAPRGGGDTKEGAIVRASEAAFEDVMDRRKRSKGACGGCWPPREAWAALLVWANWKPWVCLQAVFKKSSLSRQPLLFS